MYLSMFDQIGVIFTEENKLAELNKMNDFDHCYCGPHKYNGPNSTQ